MDNKKFHESKTPSSLNSQPSTGTDKGTFKYPQSVQSDLFNYLKPQQRKAVRPYFRIIKRPYQERLCVSLLDYLEGKGLDSFEEPVLRALQEDIVRTCGLRPLTSGSMFNVQSSRGLSSSRDNVPQPSSLNSHPSHEPTRIGTIIKQLFPGFSDSLNRNENPSSLNSHPSKGSLNPKP